MVKKTKKQNNKKPWLILGISIVVLVVLFLVLYSPAREAVFGEALRFARIAEKPMMKVELVIAEDCDDGVDNDGDGLTDCADSDCDGKAGGTVDGTDVYCRENEGDGWIAGFGYIDCLDGFDNDGDGLTDCEDDDGAQNCVEQKRKGAYEDEKGYTDEIGCFCFDHEYCKDGFDNNANGLADCYDDFDTDGDGKADCYDWKSCGTGNTCLGNYCIERNCWDGLDTDEDGLTDCEEDDCAFGYCAPGCQCVGRECIETTCDDGDDNDADGLTDCQEAYCDGRTGPNGEICEHPIETTCTDGDDNDGDGATDCADSDCSWYWGCGGIESICYDSEDNDGDGLIDCEDHDDCDGELGKLAGGDVSGADCDPYTVRHCYHFEWCCHDNFDNDANDLMDCHHSNHPDGPGPDRDCNCG